MTLAERSPLLDRPGAVEAEGADHGVAAHYGDPMREQRRLLTGEAIVDLSHREVLSVTGADRLRWLHSMTTQHLVDAAAGQSIETLVLSPKGHIEHALHLVDDGSVGALRSAALVQHPMRGDTGESLVDQPYADRGYQRSKLRSTRENIKSTAASSSLHPNAIA